MLRWKTTKPLKDTTALVEVSVKARVGSHVQHAQHGKVMLVGQPAPDKLEIEIKTDTSDWPVPGGIIISRKIVDAVECSDPQAPARARDPHVYMDTDSSERVAAALVRACCSALVRRAIATAINACGGAPQPAAGKASGKAKAKAVAGKEPKKRGRPAGSKDKKPRQPRSASKVAWVYDGMKALKGRQVAVIGAAVVHDGIGHAILLEQVDLHRLQLQAGPEGSEYAITAEASKCYAVENLEVDKGAGGSGGSGAGGSSDAVVPKRRKTGGRKRTTLTSEDESRGLNALSTKADVERIQKRRKREDAALKRGKPLKLLRPRMNKKWDSTLKDQAVAFYNSKFSGGRQWAACVKELIKLPGFNGLTDANLRAWVFVAAARAHQEPNEYGLIVTQAGKPPSVPKDLYDELIVLVRSLAETRAIRVCTSSMQPVVRTLIVHRLGAEVIRPGKGGFTVGACFLKQLAKNAELRWRKPYGDARKPPPDADAQIEDLVLRMAYLMKEHSIPRALVLNFDQTGMHFMQQRGNTFTNVEEDKDAAHESRKGKQKETKLKGTLRQA